MKTILLPTDFSDNSKNAIEYAISMFGNSKVRFILLNAYRIKPVSIEEYVEEIPDFEKESKKGLKKMLSHIRQKFPDKKLNFETISKLGYPVQVIDKISQRKKVDLIIMGTKGASGFREVLIGSITADTIKNISKPVLAIPEKALFKKIKNIAFASDFKKPEISDSLKELTEIAKNFDSEIVILHIQKNGKKMTPEKIHQKIITEKIFSKIPISFYTIEEKNVSEGIENFIKSKEIDMLVMISRKHSFIEKIFIPSKTRKLAMHTEIPFLAVQEK